MESNPSLRRERTAADLAAFAVRTALAVLGSFAMSCSAGTANATEPLPVLHADPLRTSASGVSSGAYMAMQYGVAYSSSVVGLGLVAGGPFNCADLTAGGIVGCMSGNPSGRSSWQSAQDFAARALIDPVDGLKKQRVYLFSGSKDRVVRSSVVAAARDFFEAAGVPPGNLVYVDTMPAGHALVAPAFGNDCATTGTPWIVHCADKDQPYDQPKEILEHIYGMRQPAAAKAAGRAIAFDQRAFADAASSLDATGFVYIPSACAPEASGCAVHVVFHGCQQGAQAVGSDVYESAGFNRWADANRLIVLYPQAVSTMPGNPYGCWDWWGYTGADYQRRSGRQLSAVKAMVDRLTSPK
jgi:hypothetical protein